MTVYAHTRPDWPEDRWEPLAEHAQRVSEKAEEFCARFAPGFGRALGLLHDAGKFQPAFQAYLRLNPEAYDESTAKNRKEPHAIVGAAWACRNSPGLGLLLGLPIAAHHGALKCRQEFAGAINRHAHRLASSLLAGLATSGWERSIPAQAPAWGNDKKAAALGVRMLFSALCDADMLESEAWSNQQPRPLTYAPLAALCEALERAIPKRNDAGDGRARELAELRASVSHACREAAEWTPGRFRLTVPTGGGKTLSGLRFALNHAVRYGLDRVIVVIPYTSILEQTVKVYRGVFDQIDEGAVIEHHSSLDPNGESQQHRWACENWDAPIVVTTSVQFFETLYASHKRACRKLHRIANSVVLLDEVQTFPMGLLDPIQAALTNLCKYFGTSVVSMTATQPLLARATEEREIIADVKKLYDVMRGRFQLEWMGDPGERIAWDAVADRAKREDRVLLIVHARKDAEELARILGPDCIHLSARMCAAHRIEVLNGIRQRLKRPGPCRVVATQLVEAGVDIDFPVVMRAFAGLETLAQAAGRCNREYGPQPGRFIVFRATTEPPSGTLRLGLSAAEQFYREGRFDLNDPAIFPAYTERVLQSCESDPQGVLTSEKNLDFEASAKNFRMIDNAGVSVIVPYADGWERVQRVRQAGPSVGAMRELQRYSITVYKPELRRLRQEGLIARLFPAVAEGDEDNEAVWVIPGDQQPCPYSDRFGLSWQALEEEPSTMIA
jgi:CRISPR-associated endonuclease/helicase Cas3